MLFAPGRIETEMIQEVGCEVNKEYIKKISVEWLDSKRKIGDVVLVLVYDQVGFINEVILDINSGALIF